MPVPCDECKGWIELNETRESPLKKDKMLCRECYSGASQVRDMIDEIKDIQYMLDTNDEAVKGDRRGWKANIKVLKK